MGRRRLAPRRPAAGFGGRELRRALARHMPGWAPVLVTGQRRVGCQGLAWRTAPKSARGQPGRPEAKAVCRCLASADSIAPMALCPLEAHAPPPDPRRPATFNEHGRGVESLQKAPCRRGKEIVWFIWLRGTAVCFCCYVFNSRTLRYLKSFSRAVQVDSSPRAAEASAPALLCRTPSALPSMRRGAWRRTAATASVATIRHLPARRTNRRGRRRLRARKCCRGISERSVQGGKDRSKESRSRSCHAVADALPRVPLSLEVRELLPCSGRSAEGEESVRRVHASERASELCGSAGRSRRAENVLSRPSSCGFPEG